jgi:hypothetical protein
MIIHINGYPGVGKLSVARVLAAALQGRLLDNHTICNVAFALTAFKSDAYYRTIRAVRDVAYEQVMALPSSEPIILTNAHTANSAWGRENWAATCELARRRGTPLMSVILDCELEENLRRMQSPERQPARKLIDPAANSAALERLEILDLPCDHRFRLDVTGLSPEAAAQAILAWLTPITKKPAERAGFQGAPGAEV